MHRTETEPNRNRTDTFAHLLELVDLLVLQGQDPPLLGVAADLFRGQAGRRRRAGDLFRLIV